MTFKKNEYNMTTVQVDLNHVNLMDSFEWHRKIRKVVSMMLIQSIVDVKKFWNLVVKLKKQLKHERIVNKARTTRTKEHEGKISTLASAQM